MNKLKLYSVFTAFMCCFALASCGSDATSESRSSDDSAVSEVSIKSAKDAGSFLSSANYSRLMITSPAIAPQLANVYDDSAKLKLVSAVKKESWKKLKDTELPDGESCLVFVYNEGEPFKLTVGYEGSVLLEYGGEITKYETTGTLYTAAKEAMNASLENLSDCDPENMTVNGVWSNNESEIPENAAYKVTETTYGKNDKVTNVEVYFYDSFGNKIVDLLDKNEDGTFGKKVVFEYEYNDDGTIASCVSRSDAVGEKQTFYEYTDGFVSRYYTYTNGEATDDMTYTNDEHGNHICGHSNLSGMDYNCEYEYDDRGNLITSINLFDTPDPTYMEYDENDRLISKTHDDIKETFEYDEKGNVVRREVYEDGEYIYHSESEYEYYD